MQGEVCFWHDEELRKSAGCSLLIRITRYFRSIVFLIERCESHHHGRSAVEVVPRLKQLSVVACVDSECKVPRLKVPEEPNVCSVLERTLCSWT